MFTDDTSGFGQVKLALYQDSGGEPGALVVASAAVAQTTGELSIPVGPLTVTAGTYWIAINADATSSIFFFESNSAAQTQTFFVSAPFATAASDPWPTATDTDFGQQGAYSLFATIEFDELQ